jgi:hypothetical protein
MGRLIPELERFFEGLPKSRCVRTKRLLTLKGA